MIFLLTGDVMDRFELFMTAISIFGGGAILLGLVGLWLKKHGFPY